MGCCIWKIEVNSNWTYRTNTRSVDWYIFVFVSLLLFILVWLFVYKLRDVDVNLLGQPGLAVSQRHTYLFSAGDDKQVKCWDLEQNKVLLFAVALFMWDSKLHEVSDIFSTFNYAKGYQVLSWTFEWCILLSSSSNYWCVANRWTGFCLPGMTRTTLRLVNLFGGL